MALSKSAERKVERRNVIAPLDPIEKGDVLRTDPLELGQRHLYQDPLDVTHQTVELVRGEMPRARRGHASCTELVLKLEDPGEDPCLLPGTLTKRPLVKGPGLRPIEFEDLLGELSGGDRCRCITSER